MITIKTFSSPIGAFIFLISETSSLDEAFAIVFSSPIGAFIFLIFSLSDHLDEPIHVFVPYRGFYFLNLSTRD